MPALASASLEKLLGRCGNAHASGETTRSTCRAANSAPASMRASQACSSSLLTNINTSYSRASSMHLTQRLDQPSAVGWLPGNAADTFSNAVSHSDDLHIPHSGGGVALFDCKQRLSHLR